MGINKAVVKTTSRKQTLNALDLASPQKILRRFQSLNLKINCFVLHISSDMMKTLCCFIGLAFLMIDIASGKTLSLARLDDAGDLLFELGNYLNQTDSRVDSVVEQIQTGFDALESKIDSLTADVSSLKAKVKSVKKKVDEDCCGDANCFNYRGTVAVTKEGQECQNWRAQSPTTHTYTPDNWPAMDIKGHNYCRSFYSSDSTAWCVVKDKSANNGWYWEWCDIPQC